MSKKERILEELKKKDITKKQVAKNCNTSTRYINKILQKELVNIELFKNQKSIQRLQDQQRIERKIKREDYRNYNASDKYLSEIAKEIKKFQIPELKTHKKKNEYELKNEYEGIFQLSDLHFNEIVSDLSENSYDFDVAAKRLKKYVSEAIKIFKLYKVEKILIAMTGDILGSDRRVDEKLHLATNRSRATIIGTFLLEQVIREINRYFDIKIAMVAGNESRVFELGDSDMIMEDNYDWTIFQMLKMIFRKNLNIFIDGNPYKKIIKIKNKNIMMLHGHNLGKNPENDIIKLKGQIASLHNIPLDFIIMGHIHQAQIADFYARSSSLSGGNTYSSNRLKLISRASQNIHIISENSIHSFKIDLQSVDNIIGYPINCDSHLHKSHKSKHKLIYKF